MSLFANRRVRVKENIITHIKRKLSTRGVIFVQEGQEVSPSDILGKAETSAGFRSINIAEALATSPKDAKKYLQRELGQTIYQGELLALKKGSLFSSKKMVISPTDGVIYSYDDVSGELRLKFLSHETSLPSAVYGVVEKIDQKRGELIIKTEATILHGVLGMGRERDGLLKILGKRGDLINRKEITKSLSGHIIVGGGLIYSGAISQAINDGIHGIITGGINAVDYKVLSGGEMSLKRSFGSDIGLGLFITEGFGSIPIGEDIFLVLLKYQDRFVILDGNRGKLICPAYQSDCMLRIRKTHLPFSEASLVEPVDELEALELEVGQTVRVISSPFMGEQGKVITIDKTPTLLPSQIRSYMITLKTKSRTIKVPFPNVEVIS
ncbi:hypothetical protein HY387_00560 [Candidatus Daviesbacteria bacterium]|nr:hypothetical protein [Candidatus Daviesbacteria bacterium]